MFNNIKAPPRSLGFSIIFAPSDDYGMHISYGSIDSVNCYKFYLCPDHDRLIFFAEALAGKYLLVYEKNHKLYCYCEDHDYETGTVLKDKKTPPSIEELIIRSKKNYKKSFYINLGDIENHIEGSTFDFYKKALLSYTLENSLLQKKPEKLRKI